MSTRVYRYGGLVPTSGLEVLEDQRRKAFAYRRRLVELERQKHAALVAVRAWHDPEFEHVVDRLDRAREGIRETLAEARKERERARARIDQPSRRSRLKELRAEERETLRAIGLGLSPRKWSPEAEEELAARVRARCEATGKRGPVALGAYRREALEDMLGEERWPLLWRALQRVLSRYATRRRRARADSGLYHGTYAAVEDAVESATSDSWPEPPRHGFVDTIKVGCQVVNSTSVVIDPLPSTQWDTRVGRRHAFTVARVRIQSDKGKPVYCAVPIVQHRPLPKGAVVKWAYVVTRQHALRTRYEVQLTLEVPDVEVRAQRAEACAIDLGWRAMPDGSVRVAMIRGTDGKVEDVRAPARLVERLDHADRLKSIRDQRFDEAMELARELWAGSLPQGFERWRDHQRLTRLVLERLGQQREEWVEWRARRLEQGLDLLPAPQDAPPEWWLRCWVEKDRHLWQWEHDQRRKALAYRLDLYRQVAARVGATYEQVVMEALDLRVFSRRARATDEEDQADDAIRALKTRVAPSELRDEIVRVVGGPRSPRVVKLDAALTTVTCHACGQRCELPAERELRHRCEHCGEEWDQDDNACRNLLAWRERPEAIKAARPARTKATSRKRAASRRTATPAKPAPPMVAE